MILTESSYQNIKIEGKTDNTCGEQRLNILYFMSKGEGRKLVTLRTRATTIFTSVN